MRRDMRRIHSRFRGGSALAHGTPSQSNEAESHGGKPMKTWMKRFGGQLVALAMVAWAGSAHAMVYVSSISELASKPDTLKDLFYLSHVDYALKTTGGDLADAKTGLSKLK